jgi:AraC-like DNA-binding protein
LNVQELFNHMQFRKDSLSCYLETIRIAAASANRFEYAPPWKIRVAEGSPVIYLVISGACSLRVARNKTLQLQPGDIAVLVHGKAHALECKGMFGPATTCKGSDEAHETTVLLRLNFAWDGDEIQPLLPELPGVMHVKNESWGFIPWITNTLQLAHPPSEGTDTAIRDIVRRIVHLFLVQGIRSHAIGAKAGHSRMLDAIVYGQIGPALYLLHTQPQAPWSLPSLAKRCGMCRSAFAREFKHAIGQSPMAYLADRRMHRACDLLVQGAYRIKEIALKSGYQSLPAFSSAFRKWAGVAPISYRKTQLLQENAESAVNNM